MRSSREVTRAYRHWWRRILVHASCPPGQESADLADQADAVVEIPATVAR